LRQVLGPQGRLQFLPSIRREAEGTKDTCLEASVRMFGRQQTVSKFCTIDNSVVGVRQEHVEVYCNDRTRWYSRCLTLQMSRAPRRQDSTGLGRDGSICVLGCCSEF